MTEHVRRNDWNAMRRLQLRGEALHGSGFGPARLEGKREPSPTLLLERGRIRVVPGPYEVACKVAAMRARQAAANLADGIMVRVAVAFIRCDQSGERVHQRQDDVAESIGMPAHPAVREAYPEYRNVLQAELAQCAFELFTPHEIEAFPVRKGSLPVGDAQDGNRPSRARPRMNQAARAQYLIVRVRRDDDERAVFRCPEGTIRKHF